MKDKDSIKELFSEKLGSYEAPVRADLWTGIASKVSSTTIGTSTIASMSLFTKVAISIGIVGLLAAIPILINVSNNKEKPQKSPQNTVNNKILVDSLPYKQEPLSVNEKSSPQVKTPQLHIDLSTPTLVPELNTDTLSTVINDNFRKDIERIKNEEPAVENPIYTESSNTTNTIESTEPNEVIDSDLTIESTLEESKENNTDSIKEINSIQYELGALPNIFTPNGDGNNDYLFITSKGLLDFTFVVIDSKQKVVFETTDVNFKWDGIDKFGNKVAEGNYSYYFIARDENMNKVNKFVNLSIRY